ncbi:MAG: histidine kinase [Sterolibacterium sp.]
MAPQQKAKLIRVIRVAAITAAFNTALTAILVPMLDNKFWDLLISVQVVGFTLLVLLYPAMSIRMSRLWRILSVASALVVGAFFGTVLVVLVKGRDIGMMFSDKEKLWSFVLTAAIGFIFGSIAVTVLATRARIARAEAELMRSEADRQRLARKHAEAELKVIRAQIEPHFLFNTLANLSFLIKNNPEQALAMLENLIDYLQAAVPRIRGETSTLRNELVMASAYVAILQIRMGDRLQSVFDVPQDLLALPFPPMMLITLIENAIKHGLNELPEGGTITVSASRRTDVLVLSVTDTGAGLPQLGNDSKDGIGLSNIRERLAAMYGERGKLMLTANQPRGTVATLEIPLDTGMDA